MTRWPLAALAALFLLLGPTGCPGEGDDDDVSDDDVADDDTADDDSSADDDDTADDDSSEADDDTADDDSADDDDSAADDDDSAADDDTAGDDDDDDDDADIHLMEIHLDNVSFAPVGYEFFDLPAAPIPLGAAPAVVSAELPGSLVDGCTAQDTYLGFHYCYEAPGDFGGAALVDGRSGELVFAGEIHWMGMGNLLFPTPLGPAADLQVQAGTPTIAPETVEYALFGYEDAAVGDAAIEAIRDMDLVKNWVAWCTYDALVVLHPYSEGAYDELAADLIVLLVLC